MDLYRIILVDDEEEVRQSIIRKIDWTGAGFCVVGDAENGEEALEKVEALEPDLIQTQCDRVHFKACECGGADGHFKAYQIQPGR